MTRKRKNVESDESSAPAAKNVLDAYGYKEETKPPHEITVVVYPERERTYPPSRKFLSGFGGPGMYGGRNCSARGRGRGGSQGGSRGERRGEGRGERRPQFGSRDFEKQYGRVGGGDDEEPEDRQSRDSKPDGDGREFPKEIVSYLRSIEQIKKKEGKIEDFILEKCAEEVAGQETTLLAWTEAAVVVESVFGSCPDGAALFLSSISRLKHKKLAELIFQGASARTIENLIYALTPVAKEEHVELLQKLSGILIDNWADSVTVQPASFLVRAIVWVCCGLSGRPKAGEEKKRNYAGNEMKASLKSVYEKLAVLAFDDNLNKTFGEDPIFVTLFQDFIEADALLGDKRGDEYVKKRLEKEDYEGISKAWYSPNGSRVWEKLMETCSEDARSLLWLEFCSKDVEKLTDSRFANFPLQKMINSSKSLEMVTEIIETMAPKSAFMLEHKNSGVFLAVLRCASRFPSAEKSLLQQLRKHFRAPTEAKKKTFMFNVITNNQYEGTFDTKKFTQKGSQLVQELANFSQTKTLVAGFEQLTAQQILEMSCHKFTSHLIQAVLLSETMPTEIKDKIVEAFDKDNWAKLIADTFGSRVFEKIWDYVEVKRKQEIMKVLVGIHNPSKSWKFAMLRCDQYLFRNNRKEWVAKMKKSKK